MTPEDFSSKCDLIGIYTDGEYTTAIRLHATTDTDTILFVHRQLKHHTTADARAGDVV